MGLRKVAVILLILFGAPLLLALGSNWRVTDEHHPFVDIGRESNIFYILHHKLHCSWVPDLPNIVVKERLGVIDALINLFSLFCFTITMLVMIVIGILSGIICILLGIFTADWNPVLGGALVIVVSPFFLIVPVLMWLVGLLQWPITPGYAIIWLLIALPSLIGCYAGNGLVFKEATVIIFPKV